MASLHRIRSQYSEKSDDNGRFRQQHLKRPTDEAGWYAGEINLEIKYTNLFKKRMKK